MPDAHRNPEGWHSLPVEVVTDGTMLVLIGEPPEDDEAGDVHHCDSMGCRLAHVLARVRLGPHARKALAHLLPTPEPATPPTPSLREATLARLGRTKKRFPDAD